MPTAPPSPQTHLEGALFAPLSGGKLPIAAGSYVDENARILLVVENESQVDEAVRQLIRIGLDRDRRLDSDGGGSDSIRFHHHPIRASPRRIFRPDATVLDVRGADEFAASHVKGAKNIAYTRLAARFDEVPPAGPLYVHCAGGTRAAIAAAYLASRGREVIHVDGPVRGNPRRQ